MHSFLVFLQKEFIEQWRTKRFFTLLCVLVIFSMGAPVLSRYMQEILNMTVGDLPLDLPPTTWIDSWTQFYSFIAQMGAIGVIMLFMGSISGEKQSGSAALTLTKNLSHTSFVVAKFISMVVLLVASFFPAVGIAYGYTHFLFGEAGALGHVLFAATIYFIGLVALLGIIVLASALTKTSVNSAVLAFGGYLLFFVFLEFVPGLHILVPGALTGQAIDLLTGEAFLLPALFGTLGLIVLCLLGAVYAIKRQEI